MPAYEYPHYDFVAPPELAGGRHRHKVVIVGGGPVGLTLALDLAQRGMASVILQASDSLSEGSRALCWSQRSLEILDRLGAAARLAERGFTWNRGRVFFGADEVFAFDLQPDPGAKFPAFVNLQQYLAEEFLLDAAHKHDDLIEIRWRNEVVDVKQHDDHVRAEVDTPDGRYSIEARYLVGCDGAKSTVRRSLGISWDGRVFEDHFLIADVDVGEELPWTERRFWFLPDFHQGETALCHKQGDAMWRVDFQLGWDGVDPEREATPERALPRIKAMLGDRPMAVTWLSVYTFQCRRAETLRLGRVMLAGDAAHQVSPFGARGGNSGIQDAENLAWKLALVLDARAPESLLDSYHDERGYAADENVRIASRTTDFMTAKTALRARMRRAVLGLARDYPFARAFINSGRLSTPTVHRQSPLNGPDDDFSGGPEPGAVCRNPPLPDGSGHLLDLLGRDLGFDALYFAGEAIDDAASQALAALRALPVPVRAIVIGGAAVPGLRNITDPDHKLAAAFDAGPGTIYLLRPDQHVAARWRRLDRVAIEAAQARALGRDDIALIKAGG